MRWIAWGKKLFLCLVVLVFRALKRRPDGNSSKRECAGCEGSRVILPVFLFTLGENSSWRVGRVVPMIRSAVRTISSVVFWGQIWLSWTRQLLTCRGRIQWWQSRTVSAAPVAGWTSSADEGSTASAGPFHNGLNVIVPLQVLGDCGAQEHEWLHCSHSAVHDGKWGENGCGRGGWGSPEVHDHLRCYERVELQVVKIICSCLIICIYIYLTCSMTPKRFA